MKFVLLGDLQMYCCRCFFAWNKQQFYSSGRCVTYSCSFVLIVVVLIEEQVTKGSGSTIVAAVALSDNCPGQPPASTKAQAQPVDVLGRLLQCSSQGWFVQCALILQQLAFTVSEQCVGCTTRPTSYLMQCSAITVSTICSVQKKLCILICSSVQCRWYW